MKFKQILLETINELKNSRYSSYSLISEYNESPNFNVDKLDEISTYSGKKKYCEEHLVKLGNGTSRIVYQIDGKWVLKLAKNAKGIAQNEAEASLFYSNASDCIAEISDVESGSDVYWIKMRYAKPCKQNDFKTILGVSFNEFIGILAMAYNDKKTDHLIKNINYDNENTQRLIDNEYSLPYNIAELCRNYDVHIGDFLRLSSFGLVTLENNEQEIVLIDYGATHSVIDTYYTR